MSDIHIRTEGRAGRITLTRPKALNALTPAMIAEIEQAIDTWRDDDAVALVILDGEGERAFCAGGDIAEIYRQGKTGDLDEARDFWREEYRLNAKLYHYPKPMVAFLHGFTMGGGVGIGCHASHRIVGDSSRIAMPECGIGLVPDVGGTLILARAPGRLGEYLGTTGARMNAADAILAGFADSYLPETDWDALKTALCDTGDPGRIAGQDPGPAPLALHRAEIDKHFAGVDLAGIVDDLANAGTPFAAETLKALRRVSPLSAAAAIRTIRASREADDIAAALMFEYRTTYRALDTGDMLEGIRAQVIDKDRQPRWRHADVASVPRADLDAFTAPLGAADLHLQV